jgi:hypothetical protein
MVTHSVYNTINLHICIDPCWSCLSLLWFLNVLLTCITVYQYSKTKVMHLVLSLLRINGLYTFRALLACTHAIYQVLFVERLLKMSK